MRRTTVAVLVALAAASRPQAAEDAKRPVLVTVDDLPISSARLHPADDERERITRGLLAALGKHGIRAVGLVTWRNVRDDAGRRLLDLWLDSGHELGNHTYGHLDLSEVGASAWIADAQRGRKSLAAHLARRGLALRFFRFPFLTEGGSTEQLDEARAWLARTAQRSLPVTIDDQDWSFEAPWVEARGAGGRSARSGVAEDYQASLRLAVLRQEKLGDRLLGRTTPQILLLHATEVGAAQWDRLFSWLEETGHRFATADEVLADPAFAEPPRFVASFGCGLWDRIDHLREVDAARDEILALLHDQAAAWSRGDLDAFVSVYDDDAMFVSPSGLVRGRREVLERYRKRYPDAAAMGSLTLEILDVRPTWGREVTPNGDALPGRVHGVVVVARWTLAYPEKPKSSGLTMLALERARDGWRIARDASM
jgi:uncharacterized protein (TIGR02246 family)